MTLKIKLIFLVIFVAFIAFSCKPTENFKQLQTTYIPDAISGLYIGMPLDELKDLRGAHKLSFTQKKELSIFKEEYSKDSINIIQYQFDKNNKLCEIIIEYISDYNVYKKLKASLGEPNFGNQWLITLDEKFKLRIWGYANSLCIANDKQFKE